MAVVYGKIESLRRIRETLNAKGIHRFNSIGDINRFLKNYDKEKEEILFNIEHDFEQEYETVLKEGFRLQEDYNTLKNEIERRLNNRISNLNAKCKKLASSINKNAVKELIDWYILQIFKVRLYILKKNCDRTIRRHTNKAQENLNAIKKQINYYRLNGQEIISGRCVPMFKEIEYQKLVIKNMNPLIAGSIGEYLVAKELKKLEDSYVLFNDFSIDFKRPIYNKKENDRIFSVQIDHLLVTNAGIFIIETKNWSKDSLARYDLRSPVKQIQRASYALFVILNSEKSEGSGLLGYHHWGEKQIPIRNIVVLINNKPKSKFKFVAIKKLQELNSYINFFEPIFDDNEVRRLAKYLDRIRN